MNFSTVFKQGLLGKNIGIPMGIPSLDANMNGIQRKSIYVVGAPPKCGKTTLVDYCFLISPFLYKQQNPDLPLDIIYYSWEIDRVSKEFKMAAFFLEHDYGINSFIHEDNTYDIDATYLMGRKRDLNNVPITVNSDISNVLREVYEKRIIPMFGEYDDDGRKIQKGVVDLVTQKLTPSQVKSDIESYLKARGTINNGKWIPNNPNQWTICIFDHLRKVLREKKMSLKEAVDALSNDQVEMRNNHGLTFVDIIHLNRSMSDTQRQKHLGDELYPTGDDIKDTGNLSEDANYILTMFNPMDEKYGLTSHFGKALNKTTHKNYRSLHLVESRDTECPMHFRLNMFGATNRFEQFSDVPGGYGYSDK